ncbi:MAG: CYTH domain-containing protein [Lutisporaceae bacterium]
METIERECKYQVNKADYIKLSNYLDKSFRLISNVLLNNYYIDSEDFILSKVSSSARLRAIDNRTYEFTFKQSLTKNNTYNHIRKELTISQTKSEFECIVSKKILDKESEIGKIIFDCLNISNTPIILKILGESVVERKIYNVDENVKEFALDICSYLGVIDYEIEVESENLEYAQNILNNLFDLLNIEPILDTRSKTSRFKHMYKSQKII